MTDKEIDSLQSINLKMIMPQTLPESKEGVFASEISYSEVYFPLFPIS
ncbi:hypothetical protein [Parabacteroides sp.]